MSWAVKRRFIILSIIGVFVVLVLAIVLVPTFYKTPSCTDGVRNGDEVGIDCGGGCVYVCSEQTQPPTVLYTKALQYNEGRTDVIASVENKNVGIAAKKVPYRITLYGEGQSLIQQVEGTFDLPPGSTEPVYVPGIYSGKQKVVRAFLTILNEDIKWYTLPHDGRMMPRVSRTVRAGTTDAPRVEAVLSNEHTSDLAQVRVVAVVFGEHGSVIAASQTVLPLIPALGSATATFTWNSEFTSLPTYIEIIPIVSLL